MNNSRFPTVFLAQRMKKTSKMWCNLWFKVHFLVLLITILVGVVHCNIKIQGAGINPLHRGDIGIVFWISVENVGGSPVTVSASMCHCCESLGKEEKCDDCEHMKLVPSERELLLETSFINLHLIYPTLYPHHRKGSCLVKVSAEAEATSSQDSAPTTGNDLATNNANCSSFLIQNITFDTRVFLTHVPPILKDYYGLSEVKWKFDQDEYLSPTLETEVCASPDEDPLDKCLPVDCAIKYSGSRSYFDPELRLCLKVPLCLSNPKKKLPTIAYLPNSNTCRDLENPLTVEDLEYFKLGNTEQDTASDLDMGIEMLRCHKGEEDAIAGTCKCHSGWETYSTLEDDKEPPLPEIRHDEDIFYIPFHMCTIQNYGEGPPSLVDMESLRTTPEVIPMYESGRLAGPQYSNEVTLFPRRDLFKYQKHVDVRGHPNEKSVKEKLELMVVVMMICIIMMFIVCIVLCWLCTRPRCFTCWKVKKCY